VRAAALQGPPDPAAGVVQPGSHETDRDAERSSRFPVAELVEIDELHRLSKSWRQVAERVIDRRIEAVTEPHRNRVFKPLRL
jgi:hypothetical protein